MKKKAIRPGARTTLLFILCGIWLFVSFVLEALVRLAHDGIPVSRYLDTDRQWMLLACILVTLVFVRRKREEIFSPENMLLVAFWFYYFLGYLTRGLVYHDDYLLYSSILVVAGCTSSLIGAAAGRATETRSKAQPPNTTASSPSQRRAIRTLKIALPVTVLVSAVSGLIWYQMIGTIPIFAADIEHARISLAEGTFVIRQLMSLAVVPFWLALAFGGSKKFGRLVIYSGFAVTSFLLISQGYRSFLLSFWLVSLLIAFRASRVSIPLRRVAVVGFVVVGFALSFGVYRYESSIDADSSRKGYLVAAQNFYARPEATDHIVREFPISTPYQYGRFYLMGFGFVLPGHQISPGNWLKEEVFYMDFTGAGLNPGIVGEFYLNFGIAGVLLGMFLYGLILSSLWLNTRKCGEISTVTRSMLFFYLLLAISPGLATSFVSLCWYGGVIWLFAIIIRAGRRSGHQDGATLNPMDSRIREA